MSRVPLILRKRSPWAVGNVDEIAPIMAFGTASEALANMLNE